MLYENRNYAFAGAFVDELARCGLEHVCICPGSRSSPLAISFACESRIRKWVHLDERSAAFFGLGIAKRTGQPVALVCSSGTATANFLPAIMEAYYSLTPLLVLTADRPPELLNWGALQTVDQTRMYGSHVKWSVNLPPPEATPGLLTYVRALANRGVAMARAAPAGPVHLNFPFREPLEPLNVPSDQILEDAAQDTGVHGRSGESAYVTCKNSPVGVGGAELERLATELVSRPRGIIICGPGNNDELAEPVTQLASRLGYPVLADCLSQVRCGEHDLSNVIACYDAFISTVQADRLKPEAIVRFGAWPVSKPLCQYLDRQRDAKHILVEKAPVWRDPSYLASELWEANPADFCRTLSQAIPKQLETKTKQSSQWLNTWQDLAGVAARAIAAELRDSDGMFEGTAFVELASVLPPDSILFAGNSMPVRDMDTFFPARPQPLHFMANRGASGIDGVVSTALGVSAVSDGRTVLVLGDISFYHDMNGLLAAQRFGLDATIIVINNNGGGIFSFLPQAAYEDVFETYFGTPHGLNFKAAAEQYGLEYSVPADRSMFRDAVTKSLNSSRSTLIEVKSDRQVNYRAHREIREAVAAAMRKGRS